MAGPSLTKIPPATGMPARLNTAEGGRFLFALSGYWRGRRSLVRRGATAGKLRLHDVGYQIVGLRLKDRKNDHRDREKPGQDHKSETPFLNCC